MNVDCKKPISCKYGPLIGAIDQGTSSTRFLIFRANTGELLTYSQEEIELIYPQKGWVEQDPMVLLSSVTTCIEKAIKNLITLEGNASSICTIGITNQRETTIVWDKITGKPLYNAIVWLDARTKQTVEYIIDGTPGKDRDYLKPTCGLPISTYFSAVKLKWLFENVAEVRSALEEDRLLFGTVDSWLVWNLTGGTSGGIHITDVTNASRTMLMNLRTLQWDSNLCKFFNLPMKILPSIRSSSEIFGYQVNGPLYGVPISGLVGDQQAALFGQMCLSKGQTKATFGTGCFLLQNTGSQFVESNHGLITTIAYKLGPKTEACYALEGSIAIAGAAIRWLRDNINMIESTSEVESLVKSVPDSGGVYFVPAFSGLLAPYWREDARGTICGLSQHSNRAHLIRATLEAVCFQTKEILQSMEQDSGIEILKLLVDGGMTTNNSLLQIQADILGIPVVRPSMTETTALGAAMIAGLAEGINAWNMSSLPPIVTDTFIPSVSEEERNRRFERWGMAVERSLGWELSKKKQPKADRRYRLLSSIPPIMFVIGSFCIMRLSEHFQS